LSGRIFEALMMAVSRPASIAFVQEDAVDDLADVGLDAEADVGDAQGRQGPGSSALTRRIAPMVATAAWRVSSWPVVIGKVRQSKISSRGSTP
jgi:hypothetical protein